MKITFQINYRTRWGERIVVVGNTPELGNGELYYSFGLKYTSNGNWEGTTNIEADGFQYQYVVINDDFTELNREWGEMRSFNLGETKANQIALKDTWRGKYHHENTLYNSAFLNVIFNPKTFKTPKTKKVNSPQLRFQINAPRVEAHQRLCICGNIGALGNWGAKKPLLLGNENYPLWTANVPIIPGMNVEYKYGIYDVNVKEIVFLEDGKNRVLPYSATKGQDLTIVHDNYFEHPEGDWKGVGVALPVFGLRTRNGLGIGEFTDIKLLVDWAKQVGMKMVQILPINDTSATGSWVDSYPYAAISVFALHPMYLNIEALDGFDTIIDNKAYKALQQDLNALEVVDYEAVNHHKIKFARQIFNETKGKFLASKKFKNWLKDNENWLKPYAYFCALRDKNGTADFNRWGVDAVYDEARMLDYTDSKSPHFDAISFYYYLQYHLDAQLQEVTKYARENNILLKGDIPIGIYRYSVDAWTQPHLYHMDAQAGAPPDPFSDLGQNWGFPTYNWEIMAQDGYLWWQNRLKVLSKYFDAFRIDHILGFFRIWQVPYDSVNATMGYFYPAIPVSPFELSQQGLAFDFDRFCKPFNTYEYVREVFKHEAEGIIHQFLEHWKDDLLQFKPQFDTQRKLDNYLKQPANQQWAHLKQPLFDLHANVLFIEDKKLPGQAFHPRIDLYKTYSYEAFPKHIQDKIYGVYLEYFYKRQERFWANSALTKLPPIKAATDMLICGEDLGMIPVCVPQVMKDLDILTLEIQRMSKNPNTEFLQAEDTPYYSVSSPSTHDMSPVRLWWEEESRDYIQRFYENELGETGQAPLECTPEIAKAIIQQHLDLPSMWTVFPISDLLGMNASLRHENLLAERINVPANPQHYWRYRVHLDMETLLEADDFGHELKGMIEESGR